jgi:hypothetical protein
MLKATNLKKELHKKPNTHFQNDKIVTYGNSSERVLKKQGDMHPIEKISQRVSFRPYIGTARQKRQLNKVGLSVMHPNY